MGCKNSMTQLLCGQICSCQCSETRLTSARLRQGDNGTSQTGDDGGCGLSGSGKNRSYFGGILNVEASRVWA